MKIHRSPLTLQLLLVFILGTSRAEEGNWDHLLKELGSNKFSERQKAQTQLVAQALEKPEASVQSLHGIWRVEKDFELKARLKAVLEILYQRVELGIGAPSINARFGWFLYHDGKYLSTFPQIISIDKDGAAAKAGLLPGDVLLKINDVGLWDDHSVIRLENCLKSLKPGEIAKFDIRRNAYGNTDPFDRDFRYKKKTIEVTTVADESVPAEVEIPKDGFKNWLIELSAKATPTE